MKPTDPGHGPTLSPSEAPTDPEAITGVTAIRPAAPAGFAPAGYDIGELLGRGGMGEVVLARDRRIGRDVAIKRMNMTAPTDGLIARFLREARIQARLEHPAIVPVHEVGYDADGLPFFTMKRLAGVTLHELISDPVVPVQRLLRAFAEICLAIELAHSRGIVHRDLKPSNVMLGDFGEVYVLDWGVARVLGTAEDAGEDITTLEGQTEVGALLGTPGYMAPEQARGEPAGPAADVYALGAILFEILVREPLHPRGTAGIAMTLTTPTVAPSTRRPERAIAPELDQVCVDALAADAGTRPRARELGERVQRYLDGDRDLERRRDLASTQLASAREALDSGDPTRRGEAMQAAGRALALDPDSRDAATLVSALILEPPRELPLALQQRLHQTEVDLMVRQRKLSAVAMSGYVAFLPLLAWMGVKNWPLLLVGYAMSFVVVLTAIVNARRRRPDIGLALLAHVVMMMVFTQIFGPFVLVPGLVAVVTITLLALPMLINRPWFVIGAMSSSLALPLALEATGVLEATWGFEGDRLVVRSGLLELAPTPASIFLILATFGLIVVGGLFARSLAVARRDAGRRVEIQAWHLEQLLPVRAREG